VLSRRHAHDLSHRADELRSGRPAEPVAGRVVVIVDDGMATGATMRVAVDVVRQRDPKLLVVAVPVASAEACTAVGQAADRVECVAMPTPFHAVGSWFDDFTQVSDDEVRKILSAAGPRPPA
jgi:predicted phosphoribosyltransferase